MTDQIFTYRCGSCGAEIIVTDQDISKHTCSCKAKNWTFIQAKYTDEGWQNELKVFEDTFNRIIGLFNFYVDMPINIKKVIALWIIGTYTHKEFSTYPFLFLNAMKGSGKTRTERLISYLSRGSKGDVNTGISESALFRAEEGATLVLDEMEGIASKDKQTLREYLQASYKKGATVSRMKKVRKDGKEDYELQKFHPYRPIVMANINGMDEVLGDRCLTLISEKSQNPKITKKIEDFDQNDEISSIVTTLNNKQCGLCSVVMEKNNTKKWNKYVEFKYTTTLTPLNTQTPQITLDTLSELDIAFFKILDEMEIDGRNLELVFPLLILVNSIMPSKVEEFVIIFKEMISNKVTEEVSESKDIALMEYISNQSWNEYIPIKTLLQGFKEHIGWGIEEDWLNTKWIGRALTRLQLYSNKRRLAKGPEYLLAVQRAQELTKKFKKDK